MKKILGIITVLAILISWAPLAFAITAPTVNPVKSPVDAAKQKITGNTEPRAIVIAMGGSKNISPVYADSNGKFEITVYLIQESKNTFYVQATDKDGVQSEATVIEIVESASEAKTLADTHKEDNIAPETPEIDDFETPIDADQFTFTGKAEAKSIIAITGDDNSTSTTNENGIFEIKVFLKQNKTNKFYMTASDEAGNISDDLKITIKEISEKDEKIKTTEAIITPPFTDIENHWGKEYIETLRLEGIVAGYADGTFGPDNFINRAELTLMALNAFKYNFEKESTEKSFPDVELGLWYTKAINFAKLQGIITGFPDGEFKPGEYITRDATLKIILSAAQLQIDENTNTSFPDVPTDAWFTKYAAYSEKNEIIKGYEDGTFRPGKQISRAEVAAILVKVLNLKTKLDTLPTI